jgi:hypothetical protein
MYQKLALLETSTFRAFIHSIIHLSSFINPFRYITIGKTIDARAIVEIGFPHGP